MLLMRSTLSKICLLVALQVVRGQNYESEYSAIDDGEDHADITEDEGHPDYSKYYSVDGGAAPYVSQAADGGASGFVNPAEFYSFFAQDFGASNKKQAAIAAPKNPFAKQEKETLGFVDTKDFFNFGASSPRDYFEEAQRKEQLKNQGEEDEGVFETKPGPSYISHKLPLKYESSEKDEVEAVTKKPTKLNKKPFRNPKKDYEQISEKDYKDTLLEDNKKYKIPDYSYDYPTGKYADYNVGKSSSTVSQYPTLASLTATKPTLKAFAPTLTPYQKYSFQPVSDNTNLNPKYLQTLLSTAAPFNPTYQISRSPAPFTLQTQATENTEKLDLNNCAKLVKEVPETDYATGKIQARKMDCYVCQDPKTLSKHTQCSYNSEPESDHYYAGTSQRYSVPGRDPTGFRYKRFSGDETDPYEYIRSRSLAAYKKSNPNEDQEREAYNYQPEYYNEKFEKSSSELQAEEIAKEPGNCQKITRKSMTCTVCKNPKTGGNFEQCSYSSSPQEKQYAYVTEKKYDSLDDKPEETKTTFQTAGGESEKEANKKIDDVLKESPQSSEDYAKKFANSEPIEDYKGKKYQNKRPERDYRTNERRGEESREDYQPSSSSVDKKTNDKYEYDESIAKQDDPYGYGVHKEFAESRKRLNLADADPDSSEEDKKSSLYTPYDLSKDFGEESASEPKAAGIKSSKPYEVNEDKESAEEKSDSNSEGSSSADIRDFEKEIEEYHAKYFPELAREESRQEAENEKYTSPYKSDNEHPENEQEETKEVEQVLAEFVKKDRSNCKKAERNGMTCYLCNDKNGIQHEECMYVAESKPRPTHIAYHELQKIKLPKPTIDTAESKLVEATPTVAATEIKPLTLAALTVSTPTAVPSVAPLELVAAASNGYEQRVKYEKPSKSKRSKKYEAENKKLEKEPSVAESNDEPEKLDDDDPERLSDSGPTQETPKEFQVGETEGAFSDETRPVYSKALGVTLPRYMLEKSEFEKEFDDFSASG